MGTAANGAEIEWRERGSGDAILFIHGFPFNSAMWGSQLATLPRGWRGIAPDLRGFGASEAGDSDIFEMAGFAKDLVALLDRLKIERAVVCGLSMGGYIAFELWRLHAERVRALVLCDTRAGADSPETKRARRQLAQRVLVDGPRVVADAMLPRLLAPLTYKRKPDVVSFVSALILETPRETMARTLIGMAVRPNSEPVLRTIDVPALILAGEEDAITNRGEAEMLARGIRAARIELIPGAGHLPNLEQSEDFNHALKHFLAGLPRDNLSTTPALRA
ncbi:MAG: alpha/beta fold hydrolase [Longimicrobiales bacterium]